MTDITVPLLAFGIILLLNIITIVVIHATKDDFYYGNYDKTIGKKIFFHAYFLLVGFLYYPTVGISKLIQWIRGQK